MNAKLKLIIILLVAPCVASPATADVQSPKPPVLEIRADQPGPRINKTQYGVFFEEISHAGEGGLYAELISNRSFEDSTSSIPEWTFYPIDTAIKTRYSDIQVYVVKPYSFTVLRLTNQVL